MIFVGGIFICLLTFAPTNIAADITKQSGLRGLKGNSNGNGNRNENDNGNGNGNGNGGGKKTKMKRPCTFLVREELKIPDYGNDATQSASDETLLCQLDPKDAGGKTNMVVKLKADSNQEKDLIEVIQTGKVVSGLSSYFDPDADVSDEGVFVPPGKAVVMHKKEKKERKGGKSNNRELYNNGENREGTKKYLVVRVTDGDGKVRPESAATISDDIFGTQSDLINLKSQMEACSYDKLIVEPATPVGQSASGVLDITVTARLDGDGMDSVQNAVTQQVQSELGFTLPGEFDQVLYVVEKCYGADCGYAAYAYLNHWLSLYQDYYYKQTGVLMHEIGHNLGMYHSGGLDGATYTDHTGLMGNPLYGDDLGKMCFNPAKSAFIGWYDDKITTIDGTQAHSQVHRLYGISDYGSSSSNLVNIKLETGSSQDYYVGFNLATGINSQNVEADNEVTITRAHNSNSFSYQSYLQAHLLQGESKALTIGSRTFTIIAQNINLNANPAYADVCITDTGNCNTNPPSVTPPPTMPPTRSPTSSCEDIAGWTDSYGDGCEWYETYDSEGCPNYGNYWANPTTGVTPNEACCWCGGGGSNPPPSPTLAPTPPPTPSPTLAPTPSPTPSPTSAPPSSCEDIEGWTDSYGDGCEWYEAYDNEGCPNYGNYWANPTTGITPNEACCWCGGGGSNPPPSPTPSPTPAPPSSCEDTVGWTDSYGDGCEWYETYDSEGCPNYGNYWANPTTGITPNEACCWCGGGGGSMSLEVSSVISNHKRIRTSAHVGVSQMTPQEKLLLCADFGSKCSEEENNCCTYCHDDGYCA